VSADTGLEIHNVADDDVRADFPTERAMTAPGKFLEVLECCSVRTTSSLKYRYYLIPVGNPAAVENVLFFESNFRNFEKNQQNPFITDDLLSANTSHTFV
jgi:hypothetical protein